jgi:hypothetical protein
MFGDGGQLPGEDAGLAVPKFAGLAVPKFAGLAVPKFAGLAVPKFAGLAVPKSNSAPRFFQNRDSHGADSYRAATARERTCLSILFQPIA